MRLLPALALAVGLALLVRVPALSRSLWLDEAVSMDMAARAQRSPTALIAALREADTHPPGYYLLLSAWLRLVPGDLSARWLSLLLALGHVAVLGAVAARLAGPRAGWVAALLAAVSPALAWTGYEVRSFSLFALLATTLWWVLLGALERGGWWRHALLALLAAACLYTFYYAAIVCCALLACALALAPSWRRLLPVLLAGLVAALLFVPWLPVVEEQLARVRAATAGGRNATGASWRWFFDKWLAQHLVLAGPWGAWGALGGLGALLAGRWWWRAPFLAGPWPPPADPVERRALGATWALGLAFVGCVLLFGLLGGFTGRRYVTFLAGVWCVLGALVLPRLPRAFGRAALIVVVVGCSTQALYSAFTAEREDWRSAAAHVRAAAAPQARVATWPAFTSVCVRHYAQGTAALGEARGLPDELLPALPTGVPDTPLSRLDAWLSDRDELWLVRVDRRDGREERDPGQVELLAHLQTAGWEALPRRAFQGVEVLSWRRRR